MGRFESYRVVAQTLLGDSLGLILGLAARGDPARTLDHVWSKLKELRQGYAWAWDAAGRSGAASITCPFYRELRDLLGPRHTSSPPATLDTSAEEPQQAPEVESAPEASPAPWGPLLEPTPGALEQEEEEEGDSSSTETGLQILLLPSRSSSRASAPLGVPRPWEWTYSCTMGRTGECRRGVSGPEIPSGAIAPGQPLGGGPTGPTAGKTADPAPPPDGDGPPAAGSPPPAGGGRGAVAAGGATPLPPTGAGAGLAPRGMGGLHGDL
ncbi:uncharacterized protein LOC142014510 [Carettochelys insculpta]|uniref:uncharacterized protein LOC142014510 n=1 Tax=Carettochelys insculpta TaxID=44489 RepID=UPI003EBDA5A5